MTICCNQQLIDLSKPKVMGILNLTPDSFYDGGKYKNVDTILRSVSKMLDDGATFIDVGAYSSRPGATHISADEELRRLIPIVELLISTFSNIILSIDTFRASVAKKAINAGAAIINDISAGLLDTHMVDTIGKLQVPYIAMHMKGNPQNMQQNNSYVNLIKDMQLYFSERLSIFRAAKINDVIIDPGFGFSKDISQNFDILNQMDNFCIQDVPLLVGLSRKSMIYNTLNLQAKDALNGTSVLNTIALQKGASILRVHDVKEAKECIDLLQCLK